MPSITTTKKKKTVSKVKSYDLTIDQVDENAGGLWSQEIQAWMQATTLKSLFFSEDWVFICCDLIASEISSLPRQVARKIVDADGNISYEPAANHPLQALLDNPNRFISRVAFRYLETVEHVLMGNAIIWNAKTNNELFILRTEDVMLNFNGKNPEPVYNYVIEPEDIFNKTSANIVLDNRDIMHIKRPNPVSIWWGLSPFVPGRKSLLFNRYSSDYMNSFYLKGASPQHVLTLDKDANQETIARMLKSFEMAYTGRRNMRRTMLLPKGVDIKTVGVSVADQDFVNLVQLNRETVLQILHIPKHAVGLADNGSLGSQEFKQALKYFWQSTIIPTDKAINSAYNLFFKAQLGDAYEIISDYSNVQILQDDELAKAETATKLLTTHTINEVRQKIYALPAIQGGDVILELEKINKTASQQPAATQAAVIEQLPATTIQEAMPIAKSEVETFIIDVPNEASDYAKIGIEWLNEFGSSHFAEKNIDNIKEIANRFANKKVIAKDIYIAKEFFTKYASKIHNTLENGDPARCKVIAYCLGYIPMKRYASNKQTVQGNIEQLPVFESLELDSHGSYHIADFHKALAEKYKTKEPYEAMFEGEKKRIKTIEELAFSTLEKFFNVGIKIVVDELNNSAKKAFDDVPEGSDEPPKEIRKAKLRRELNDAYAELSKEWQKEYGDILEAQVELGYDSQLNLSFMRQNAEAIEALRDRDAKNRRTILQARGLDSFAKISKTTTENIMNVVENGMKEGESVSEIGRKIAQHFKEITPVRAETIARTETLTASSLGQAAAMENAAEVIPDLKKAWLNAGDVLVRGNPAGEYADSEFDHWFVQNEGPIAWNKSFSNGLKFPREPGGEAGNVINCRCTLITIAPEDAQAVRVPRRR